MNNPFTRFALFREPTALEIAARSLEQAKRDLLAHSSQREYYAAMEEMLAERIGRLESSVRDLSSSSQET